MLKRNLIVAFSVLSVAASFAQAGEWRKDIKVGKHSVLVDTGAKGARGVLLEKQVLDGKSSYSLRLFNGTTVTKSSAVSPERYDEFYSRLEKMYRTQKLLNGHRVGTPYAPCNHEVKLMISGQKDAAVMDAVCVDHMTASQRTEFKDWDSDVKKLLPGVNG